ncbi:O-antigen ligase family protein [Aequorivita todarodis]|uniref:O-antigen ligase family protein n=1 Tax=Aequorivita todarodis TaxID=2036821 RepID=UPI00234FE4ED|nr:O-antigen ligase family protein [Aequorivita todarodis]MDC8002353.1 O-antigen ligase family protein [Aequorivita todarodis]
MIKGIKSYWNNNTPRRIFFETSTYLFVATLPLWDNLNTIVLWFFVASSIFLLSPKVRLQNLKKNKIAFYFLVALYLLFILGWVFSTNVKDALRDMERTLTLVLIPFIILSHKREDFNLKRIYISFGTGLFIGMVICWAYIIESILTNATPWVQAGYFFKWIYNGWNALKPLDGHPSYFAVMLVIFILGVIRMPEFIHLRKNKLKLILLLAPFFLFLIETSSRIGLICLIVMIAVTIFRKLELKKIFYLIGFVALLAILSIKFDYLGSKFAMVVDTQGNVTLDRYPRWIAILSEFKERGNWVLGIGTGDAQALYDLSYSKGNFTIALNNHYNAHNQYLEFLVSNGILGIFIYSMALLFFLWKTNLKGEAMSFFIIITLFSFSESIFGISKGVFIFAFFYSFFVLWYSGKSLKLNQNEAKERLCVE